MAHLSAQQIQCHMAQDRHILCAMAPTDTTVVLAKADIKDPMERMFHAPVLPDGLSKTDGITGQRGQEKSLFKRDHPGHVAL